MLLSSLLLLLLLLLLLCSLLLQLDDEGAEAALKSLDGATFDGREIRVRLQKPQ
jgi:hypothetical protein